MSNDLPSKNNVIQGLYELDCNGENFKVLLSKVVLAREVRKVTMLREHAWWWTNEKEKV